MTTVQYPISHTYPIMFIYVDFVVLDDRLIKYNDLIVKQLKIKVILDSVNCEAQGKGRARGRPKKVTQRSFIDGGWWMVDILSLMLYTKFGCHPPPPERLIFTMFMACRVRGR